MTLLPIVERELRVASRGRGTYRIRLATAIGAIVVFGWVGFLMIRESVPSTSHGLYLFRALFGLGFAYCLFIGAPLTSDSLSAEKREQTLGLLFLTDLKGYDVVLGKLAATSVNSVYGLLTLIPIMALTTQLGGVTAMEVIRAGFVLLNTMFFSLAAGILVSTLSRNERKAMFGTLLLVLAAVFSPLILWQLLNHYWSAGPLGSSESLVSLLVSPAYSFVLTLMTGIPGLPVPVSSFWTSLALVHGLGWLMLAVASGILPRVWLGGRAVQRLENQRQRVEQLAYGSRTARGIHRKQLLDVNPFLWLAGRERWKHYYVWVYFGAVAATWLWGWYNYGDVMVDRKVLIPTLLVFQGFLKIWVISEACNRLVEDRRSGALELLLSTPLTTREILRGQWLSLYRQFARPLALIVVCEFFVLLQAFPIEIALMNLGVLVADMWALGWIAMWIGLHSNSTNRAILASIGLVLILPWGIYYGLGVMLEFALGVIRAGVASEPFSLSIRVLIWCLISLMTDVVFAVYWARSGLLHQFRTAVVQRSDSGRGSRAVTKERHAAAPAAETVASAA